MRFVYNLFKNNQFPALKPNTPKSPSRGTLYYRESVGKLIKVLPGFFVPADSIINDENLMQWIHAKQPDAVMSLVSALSFHGLTTQIPACLSVSLPRGKHIPKNFVTPVKVWYTKGTWHLCGVTQYSGAFGTYLVTSPERTLVDCFRYRNKIGLDIFLESLQIGIRERRYDLNMIAELSAIFNVSSLITPYIKTAVA